jgi:hypothetical protein
MVGCAATADAAGISDVPLVHCRTTSCTSAFAWERHAPAWLLEPGWSPAFPGECTSTAVQMHQVRTGWILLRGLVSQAMLDMRCYS